MFNICKHIELFIRLFACYLFNYDYFKTNDIKFSDAIGDLIEKYSQNNQEQYETFCFIIENKLFPYTTAEREHEELKIITKLKEERLNELKNIDKKQLIVCFSTNNLLVFIVLMKQF